MVQRQIEDKFVLLQDTEQIKVNILVMTNLKNAERFRSCVTNYSKKISLQMNILNTLFEYWMFCL